MTQAEQYIADAAKKLLQAKKSDSFIRLNPMEQARILFAAEQLQLVLSKFGLDK